MAGTYTKLYSTGDPADKAYLMEEGKLLFSQGSDNSYTLSGRKMVTGAAELILNIFKETPEPLKRLDDSYYAAGSKIKTISAENFRKGLSSLAFITNTSAVLAKELSLTNEILNRYILHIQEDDIRLRELSIKYYYMIEKLRKENATRRFPWLTELIKENEINLCYKRGMAHCKSSDAPKIMSTVQLSEKMVEYPRNSIICEKGTPGTDMFILQRGAIDVMLDSRIATIEGKGTIIGEMAMLLGEKRQATLVAKNSVVLAKISRADFKAISTQDLTLALTIMKFLAKRYYYNCIKIKDTVKNADGFISDKELAEKQKAIEQTKASIKKLEDKITDLYRKKKTDFLRDVLKTETA